ncbi:uncharacterized protein LOC106013027 [Aplysia californica]|uniref:Galectin n=1 Tax=Aplysia californica TaxID=6500 RepID=A0ABM1A906_APLCA|nr:uncharacterized protein LOC106013027 [Aplysia californica]
MARLLRTQQQTVSTFPLTLQCLCLLLLLTYPTAHVSSLETKQLSCAGSQGHIISTCDQKTVDASPTTTSVMPCVRACNELPECLAFNFNKISGVCSLCQRRHVTDFGPSNDAENSVRYLCFDTQHYWSNPPSFLPISMPKGSYNGQIVRVSGVAMETTFGISFRNMPCANDTSSCEIDATFDVEVKENRLAASKMVFQTVGRKIYSSLNGLVVKGRRFELLILVGDTEYKVFVNNQLVASYGRLLIFGLQDFVYLVFTGDLEQLQISFVA